MNLGCPLLVPGLGLTETSCCLFERIYKVVKDEPRPAIHMGKQFGWACKLGGVESQGISRVGKLLARLMGSQICGVCHFVWGGGVQKKDNDLCLPQCQTIQFLPPCHWCFQAATLVLDLRGSESE